MSIPVSAGLYTEIPLDPFVVEANEIVAVFLIPIDYVSSI